MSERPTTTNTMPLGGNKRGRASFTSYTNKHGAMRAVLTFDYEIAMRAAVGDDEAQALILDTLAEAVKRDEAQE